MAVAEYPVDLPFVPRKHRPNIGGVAVRAVLPNRQNVLVVEKWSRRVGDAVCGGKMVLSHFNAHFESLAWFWWERRCWYRSDTDGIGR